MAGLLRWQGLLTTARLPAEVHLQEQCRQTAADRTRTDDLRFTKPLLYQLSYGGVRHIVVRTRNDAQVTPPAKPPRPAAIAKDHPALIAPWAAPVRQAARRLKDHH